MQFFSNLLAKAVARKRKEHRGRLFRRHFRSQRGQVIEELRNGLPVVSRLRAVAAAGRRCLALGLQGLDDVLGEDPAEVRRKVGKLFERNLKQFQRYSLITCGTFRCFE